MTNKLSFVSRLAFGVLLLVGVMADERHCAAAEPNSLRQPATTLVVKETGSEASATAAAAPTALKSDPASHRVAMASATIAQPAACVPCSPSASAFTPHYLCLCPPYCQKPEPCVDCSYKCCPDCYCSKPMPCPNPCYRGLCDNYCAKPMPCNFPQPLCGPQAPCRQSEPCPLYAPWPVRGPCWGP